VRKNGRDVPLTAVSTCSNRLARMLESRRTTAEDSLSRRCLENRELIRALENSDPIIIVVTPLPKSASSRPTIVRERAIKPSRLEMTLLHPSAGEPRWGGLEFGIFQLQLRALGITSTPEDRFVGPPASV